MNSDDMNSDVQIQQGEPYLVFFSSKFCEGLTATYYWGEKVEKWSGKTVQKFF